MNVKKLILLLGNLFFTCLAAAALAQQAADPLLAKLNVLPPDERQAALVKGAQSERAVEWYATLPVEHSKVLIEAFRQRYPFIEVKYTGAGGGRMVNRVVTEDRAGLGGHVMIRDGPWKYVWSQFDLDELYDLARDPGETTNLGADAAQQERIRGFRLQIGAMVQNTGPGVYTWCLDPDRRPSQPPLLLDSAATLKDEGQA